MVRSKKPRKPAILTDQFVFVTYEVEQLVRDIANNLNISNQDALMLLYSVGRKVVKVEEDTGDSGQV